MRNKKYPRTGKTWTEGEEAYLRTHWRNKTDEDFSKVLQRSPASIYAKRKNMGVWERKKVVNTLNDFTTEEDLFIANNYMKMLDQEIADKLGRKRQQICDRRKKLGLKKYGVKKAKAEQLQLNTNTPKDTPRDVPKVKVKPDPKPKPNPKPECKRCGFIKIGWFKFPVYLER